jgi:hypothetical protein
MRKLKSGREKWEYPQTSPENRHTLPATATHVYGCTSSRRGGRNAAPDEAPYGIIEVFTHEGKRAARNTLSRGELSDEHGARLIEQGRRLDRWAYACAMNTGGNRLYIASQEFLYCIGEK